MPKSVYNEHAKVPLVLHKDGGARAGPILPANAKAFQEVQRICKQLHIDIGISDDWTNEGKEEWFVDTLAPKSDACALEWTLEFWNKHEDALLMCILYAIVSTVCGMGKGVWKSLVYSPSKDVLTKVDWSVSQTLIDWKSTQTIKGWMSLWLDVEEDDAFVGTVFEVMCDTLLRCTRTGSASRLLYGFSKQLPSCVPASGHSAAQKCIRFLSDKLIGKPKEEEEEEEKTRPANLEKKKNKRIEEEEEPVRKPLAKKKSKRVEDEEEEPVRKPLAKKKSKRMEEEEEEEEPPRKVLTKKKNKRIEEEEPVRKSKKNKRVEEEEEEDLLDEYDEEDSFIEDDEEEDSFIEDDDEEEEESYRHRSSFKSRFIDDEASDDEDLRSTSEEEERFQPKKKSKPIAKPSKSVSSKPVSKPAKTSSKLAKTSTKPSAKPISSKPSSTPSTKKASSKPVGKGTKRKAIQEEEEEEAEKQLSSVEEEGEERGRKKRKLNAGQSVRKGRLEVDDDRYKALKDCFPDLKPITEEDRAADEDMELEANAARCVLTVGKEAFLFGAKYWKLSSSPALSMEWLDERVSDPSSSPSSSSSSSDAKDSKDSATKLKQSVELTSLLQTLQQTIVEKDWPQASRCLMTLCSWYALSPSSKKGSTALFYRPLRTVLTKIVYSVCYELVLEYMQPQADVLEQVSAFVRKWEKELSGKTFESKLLPTIQALITLLKVLATDARVVWNPTPMTRRDWKVETSSSSSEPVKKASDKTLEGKPAQKSIRSLFQEQTVAFRTSMANVCAKIWKEELDWTLDSILEWSRANIWQDSHTRRLGLEQLRFRALLKKDEQSSVLSKDSLRILNSMEGFGLFSETRIVSSSGDAARSVVRPLVYALRLFVSTNH